MKQLHAFPALSSPLATASACADGYLHQPPDRGAGPAEAAPLSAAWLLGVLDLPRNAQVSLTRDPIMARGIGLAAARDDQLRRAGYDVADTGLQYAPPVTALIAEDTGPEILTALRHLGFGNWNMARVATDDQGRLDLAALGRRLAARQGPAIVVATAGHAHTGAFDDLGAIADLAARHGAWLHVECAAGFWARTSVTTRSLTDGFGRADSLSAGGQPWLGHPAESGFAIVRGPRRAGALRPSLARPESSADIAADRARIGGLVRNQCDCASLLAFKLRRVAGLQVLNDVVLNRVVLGFDDAASAGRTAATLAGALNTPDHDFCRVARWRDRTVLAITITGADTGPGHMQALARGITALMDGVRH